MNLLQIGINLVLAILAFVLTTALLGELVTNDTLIFVVALLVAVGVFFANFARRISA